MKVAIGSRDEDPQFAKWLTYGIIASVLLHLTLFLLLQIEWKHPSAPPSIFEVSLVPPPQFRKQKPQIVSEPENPISQIPQEDALFEAEKNHRTDKQQIKRGAGRDAGPAIGGKQAPPPASPRRTAPTTPRKKVPAPPKKKITSLRLSPENLLGEFHKESNTSKDMGPPAREFLKAPTNLSSYRPFSRPTGSGARFLGQNGSNDYLPNLPDGDITLLNAKANKFAVFVRRVATQVFSTLRVSGWESLSSQDITRMKDMSTIEAILSPQGKLLTVKLTHPSGSARFDDVLFESVKSGAKDPHPPPGALAIDGKIHFIFQAKSWSQVGPSRGGKGIAEHRWLLLGTGLG